jgi:hypothetical protein
VPSGGDSSGDHVNTNFINNVALRAKKLDEVPSGFLAATRTRSGSTWTPGWTPSPPPGLSRPVLPMNPGRFFHTSGDGAVPKGHLHAISIADALAIHVPVLR